MIVLASKSPRRQMLMKRITPTFIIYDSNIDEDKYRSLPPIEACKSIALHKALKAKEVYKDEIKGDKK